MKQKPAKTKSLLNKILMISGAVFIASTLVYWLIYFCSDLIGPTTDQQNNVFYYVVMTITTLIDVGLACFGIALLFARSKVNKVIGILVLLTVILMVLPATLSTANEPLTDAEQNWLNIRFALVALFYVVAPILAAILSKPRSKYLVIFAWASALLWIIALIIGMLPTEVLATRMGGLNLTDLFYSLVMAPFLCFVGYYAFTAFKSGVFKK